MIFILMTVLLGLIALGARAWTLSRRGQFVSRHSAGIPEVDHDQSGVSQTIERPTSIHVGWDVPVVAALIITALTTIGYLVIMRAQHDSPKWWFLTGLVLAVLLLAYSARRAAPHRMPVLAFGAANLVVLGVLGLLSIGLPLLIAGGLAFAAAGRR